MKYIKLTLVLQGPLHEYTSQIVDEYLKLPFVNSIIVSCWNTCPDYIFNKKVIVIRNSDVEYSGVGNRNRQIKSTLEGIKHATTDFAIKLRTDQFISYDSMIDIYNFYFNNNKIEIQYLNKKGPNYKIGIHGICKDFAFHLIDHIYFGHVQDLLEVFSIQYDKTVAPSDSEILFNHVVRSEIYITIPYISKFDTRIEDYIKDPLSYLVDNGHKRSDALVTSRELMDKIFVNFPKTNMQWPKYGMKLYHYDIMESEQGGHTYWHDTKKYNKDKHMNFIMGGKLGDFIHTLFVVKNICERDNIMANLYMYDIGWEHGIDMTYNELKDILVSQPYIKSFEILSKYKFNNNRVDVYNEQLVKEGYIDLGNYIRSDNLYKCCWSDIFQKDYNFEIKEYKWLFFTKTDLKFSNKVVINRRNNIIRLNPDFPYEEIVEAYKDNLIFISTSEDDYNSFKYKNKCEFYKIKSMDDWFTSINSAELFIGNLSGPASIASGFNKKRMIELPNTIDAYHWIGEEKYSRNITWFFNRELCHNMTCLN
jgi:ADP-heptose:LPS heptosyltransferase